MNTQAQEPAVHIINPQGSMPRGMDDFAKAVMQQRCLVDKTLFVEQLLQRGDEVTLITRPRRFGKTINQSMLRYFFEKPIGNDEEAKKLFENTLISQNDTMMQHQGKYPVISLTLKSAKLPTWDRAYNELCQLIHEEIQRHPEALQWQIGEFERMHGQQWKRILHRTEATQDDWAHSLQLLCKLLTLHHNKDNSNSFTWTMPIVLIDEYDAPIHAAYTHSAKRSEELKDDNSYYSRMVSFIRVLLSNALKGNKYLHKAVLTGIFRVAKEDIFSGLNNPGVYGVLDEEFSEFFGFTEPEVQELLERRGLIHRLDDVRRWYDGYHFGDTAVYNPWSLISFVGSKARETKPYWVNTSDNALIHTLVRLADADIKGELLQLLSGTAHHVVRAIHDEAPLRMLTGSAKELWSLLLASGYATADQSGYDSEKGGPNIAHLRLPNLEVTTLYKQLIEEWFALEPRKQQTAGMIKALLSGSGELFAQRLQAFVQTSMSYFSLGGEDSERVYQAFVLGLLIQLEQDYHLRSEREAGDGRADVLLIPKQTDKPGIILEFKLTENALEEKDQAKMMHRLQHSAQAALQQIKDKNYAAAFADCNCSFILAVGIAFAGKRLAAAHERLS